MKRTKVAQLGGRARARKLTAQQRQDIARKAAQTRWHDKPGARVPTLQVINRLLNATNKRHSHHVAQSGDMMGQSPPWNVVYIGDVITPRIEVWKPGYTRPDAIVIDAHPITEDEATTLTINELEARYPCVRVRP